MSPMLVESCPPEKRRGEPVIRRVLAATIEEVALTGYAGLTLERVAARAGVNRTTIYRRWPTKPELIAATLRFAAEQIVFDWDEGSLRADLTRLLDRAAQTFFAPGMLGVHRLMIEAQHHPALSEIARRTRDEHAAHALAMLGRAEKRGELAADLDKELFLDLIFGALFSRVVFQRGEITPRFSRVLIAHLLKVAAPTQPTRSRRFRSSGKTKVKTARGA